MSAVFVVVSIAVLLLQDSNPARGGLESFRWRTAVLVRQDGGEDWCVVGVASCVCESIEIVGM
ncbi:MAG: hypothetical protein K2H92_06850 [Bacteroidaceae bacterium]|nr:hypothetical protein [Bacteroidaceae bacterium]